MAKDTRRAQLCSSIILWGGLAKATRDYSTHRCFMELAYYSAPFTARNQTAAMELCSRSLSDLAVRRSPKVNVVQASKIDSLR